ncbi:hypothetical protein P9112_002914 [Eukaryota sp. TZLM1-RC]
MANNSQFTQDDLLETESIEDTIEPSSNAALLSSMLKAAEERRSFHHKPARRSSVTEHIPMERSKPLEPPKEVFRQNSIDDIISFYHSCISSNADIETAIRRLQSYRQSS